MTSFDFIRRLKRSLPREFHKLGHFGTLDRFASGLLIIGLGKSLKLNELSQSFFPKTYYAKGFIGQRTDTGDPNGAIIDDISNSDRDHIQKLSNQNIIDVLNSFKGEYWQSPPLYSAAKYQGKRLSDLARSGIIIEKEKKRREIYSIELIHFSFPHVEFRLTVSSGTYIRTFFEDFCEKIGGKGHLLELRREAIGPYHLQIAGRVEDLPERDDFETLIAKGMEMTDFLPLHYVQLSDKQSRLFSNGHFIRYYKVEGKPDTHLQSDYLWVYNHLEELIGLGMIDSERENQVCPKFII